MAMAYDLSLCAVCSHGAACRRSQLFHPQSAEVTTHVGIHAFGEIVEPCCDLGQHQESGMLPTQFIMRRDDLVISGISRKGSRSFTAVLPLHIALPAENQDIRFFHGDII